MNTFNDLATKLENLKFEPYWAGLETDLMSDRHGLEKATYTCTDPSARFNGYVVDVWGDGSFDVNPLEAHRGDAETTDTLYYELALAKSRLYAEGSNRNASAILSTNGFWLSGERTNPATGYTHMEFRGSSTNQFRGIRVVVELVSGDYRIETYHTFADPAMVDLLADLLRRTAEPGKLTPGTIVTHTDTQSLYHGVVIKETEKAVLTYCYYAGLRRDYNFSFWTPKKFVKEQTGSVGTTYYHRLPNWFNDIRIVHYYNQGFQTPEEVCKAHNTKYEPTTNA